MRRRVYTGELVRVIGRTDDGLELESAARLRPGQCVDLVLDRPALGDGDARAAFVMTWTVARLGKDGPIYRGLCRWQ